MEDLFKAFLDFMTDLFAALSEFLGKNLGIGDIIGSLEGVVGGEEDTTADAE
ncbi:MAG: hypothetical protein IJO68_07450 [Clostridia bacterium]|nr:hypothetical protein [Clostridia bacterium]